MRSAGFGFAEAVGPDGKVWIGLVPGADVAVVSTIPAEGATTTADYIQIVVNRSQTEQQAVVDAAAAAAKLALRYKFDCGGSYSSGSKTGVYETFKEVWASSSYTDGSSCNVTIEGKPFYELKELLPSEKAIVDVVAQNGGDARIPGVTLAIVLGLCTKVDAEYPDRIMADIASKKAQAQAALSLCPDAPHAAALNEVVTVAKVGDGNKVVGTDMEPGTYKTKPSIADCYSSRNTGGGDIMANDFVGFAPDGVTVTVYPGEGFESQRCGVWTKVG